MSTAAQEDREQEGKIGWGDAVQGENSSAATGKGERSKLQYCEDELELHKLVVLPPPTLLLGCGMVRAVNNAAGK